MIRKRSARRSPTAQLTTLSKEALARVSGGYGWSDWYDWGFGYEETPPLLWGGFTLSSYAGAPDE